MRLVGPGLFVPLLVAALLWPGASSAQEEAPGLAGIWVTDEGHDVLLLYENGSATATYIDPEDGRCPGPEASSAGEERAFFIKGQLDGEELRGTMVRCTRDPHLMSACGLAPAYTTQFTARLATAGLIEGTRRTEWYDETGSGSAPPDGDTEDDPAEEHCRYKRNPSGDTDASFSLHLLSPACDEEAIEAAKAEYLRLVETAGWLAANGDDMWRGAMDAHEEMEDHFHSFVGSKMIGQATGKLWGKVPEPLRTSARTGIGAYTAETPGEAAKVSLDAAKGLSSHLKDTASWAQSGSQAFKKANWGSLLVDLGLLAAKMNTSYQVGEAYAQQAEGAAEARSRMMELALEALRRWEALEEQCRQASDRPAAEEYEEDAPTTTADEQRVAAAAALVASWERIGGLYVDLQGNAYDEQAAWQRALEIVGSGGQEVSEERAEANGSSAAAMPAETAGGEFSPQEISAFVAHMSRGLDLLAARLEAQLRIEDELRRLAPD